MTPDETQAIRRFRSGCEEKITLEAYSKHLDQFCMYSKLSYGDILILDVDSLQNKLEDWVMYLGEKGLKGSSVKKMIAGVQKFLDMNRKLYHKKALMGLIKENRNESDEIAGKVAYTSDEIHSMLESTTKLRNKALIHIMATGIRPAGLVDPILRMKHLSIQFEGEKDTGCYALRVYDNSPEGYSENSKHGYWVFLTPEGRKALNAYLNSRKLNGETFEKETPLFRVVSQKTPLTLRAVYSMMGTIIKASGIYRKKIDYRYDKAINYGFRKRFNTILKLGDNKNANIAEKLMAHKRGLDGTYLTPTKDECFAEFRKAIPDLTIDKSEKLKVQLEQSEKEKTDLTVKSDRIDELERIVYRLVHSREITNLN